MTNLERLKMEIKGVNIDDEELTVYLQENGLKEDAEYNPESNSNKKAILQTALNVLESIANNPQSLKDYKTEDITISNFANNLQQRIDYLNRKIRLMPDDTDYGEFGGATVGYLFTE